MSKRFFSICALCVFYMFYENVSNIWYLMRRLFFAVGFFAQKYQIYIEELTLRKPCQNTAQRKPVFWHILRRVTLEKLLILASEWHFKKKKTARHKLRGLIKLVAPSYKLLKKILSSITFNSHLNSECYLDCAVLKNFARVTGKTPQQSSFYTNVTGLGLPLYFKKVLTAGDFLLFVSCILVKPLD